MTDETVVIVGTGHAGGLTAVNLRAKGFEGPIRLIGDEPHVPYERPPLSKQLLAGEIEPERCFLRKPDFYAAKEIEFRPSQRVEAIERDAHAVRLANGERLGYAKLVLATGSRMRRLEVPGAGLEGIHYLRTLDQSLALRADLERAGEVVVVGAGYIGLEVAASARKRGCHVSVIEMLDRAMARVVAPEVSAFVAAYHRDRGVELRFGVGLAGFEGSGRIEAVRLADETTLPADVAVVGVGILPDDALAAAAGLAVEDGIVVDEFGRSSDPDILAAGDVTSHPSALYARRVRLECVQNAVAQAKAVAGALCGTPTPYDEVPWFWSDQFDLKIQIAGLSAGADRVVVRASPGEARFAAAYLEDGVLVALDAINRAKDFVQARKLIARRARLDPARLADPAVPLVETVA